MVGGQAINLWAARFTSRLDELDQHGPFTSKDVDLFGDEKAVRECAARLEGLPVFPEDRFERHAEINSGMVRYVDSAGVQRQIDMLIQLYGVDEQELQETCVQIQTDDGSTIQVMHPVLCLEGRAAMVTGMGRHDEHTLRQLRASVLCAREFLRDILNPASPREVLNWNERLFWFAKSRRGREIFRTYQIDLSRAILVDGLPEMFRQRRYPQMQEVLGRVQAR